MPIEKCAVWATMEALPDRVDDARAFLKEAARRLGGEPGTLRFYAMEIGDRQFAIFNVFADESAFAAHVNGDVAQWVKQSQPDLFVGPYEITRTDILTTKAEMSGV